MYRERAAIITATSLLVAIMLPPFLPRGWSREGDPRPDKANVPKNNILSWRSSAQFLTAVLGECYEQHMCCRRVGPKRGPCSRREWRRVLLSGEDK